MADKSETTPTAERSLVRLAPESVAARLTVAAGSGIGCVDLADESTQPAVDI